MDDEIIVLEHETNLCTALPLLLVSKMSLYCALRVYRSVSRGRFKSDHASRLEANPSLCQGTIGHEPDAWMDHHPVRQETH